MTVRRERRGLVGCSPFDLPRVCGADNLSTVLGVAFVQRLAEVTGTLPFSRLLIARVAGCGCGTDCTIPDKMARCRRRDPRDRDASGRGPIQRRNIGSSKTTTSSPGVVPLRDTSLGTSPRHVCSGMVPGTATHASPTISRDRPRAGGYRSGAMSCDTASCSPSPDKSETYPGTKRFSAVRLSPWRCATRT